MRIAVRPMNETRSKILRLSAERQALIDQLLGT